MLIAHCVPVAPRSSANPSTLGLRGKVDSWRMLAYRAGEHVRLAGRNGRHHTRRFADVAAAVTKLSTRTLPIDGVGAIYHLLPPIPIRLVA
jgi:hypothetical protein